MILLLGFFESSKKYKHSTPFFGFTKIYKVMIWCGPITCDEINKRMTLHDLAQGSGGTWLDGGLLSPREPTNQSPVSRTQFQNTNQQNKKI